MSEKSADIISHSAHTFSLHTYRHTYAIAVPSRQNIKLGYFLENVSSPETNLVRLQ